MEMICILNFDRGKKAAQPKQERWDLDVEVVVDLQVHSQQHALRNRSCVSVVSTGYRVRKQGELAHNRPPNFKKTRLT